MGTTGEVSADASETDETLIDGIDLLGRPQGGGDAHEAVAHVAVENKIGGYRDDARELPSDLEVRVTHGDAQGLGLVAPGNGTAVIVAQDNDGVPFQRGSEDPLA